MLLNPYSEDTWPTVTHINKGNLKHILLNGKKKQATGLHYEIQSNF